MISARHIALGLVAATLGGCTYPTFEFAAGGAGGAGGTGASAAPGTTTDTSGVTSGVTIPVTTSGTGVVTTGPTGPTGAVSSSATGGGVITPCATSHVPGGGPCELLGKQCGCDFKIDKCSIDTETTGSTKCISKGSLGFSQRCDSDDDCIAGAWCDHFTSTCEKICQSTSDCGGGKCIQAPTATLMSSIPGLNICTSNCNPLTAIPCGADTTCAFDNQVLVFDCFASAKKPAGAACNFLNDCDKKLVCAPNSKTCTQWCTAASQCPAQKPKCLPFTPAIKPGTTEFGFCSL